MATSNFNLNAMTNGLNAILPYTPESYEDFLANNDFEGLSDDELEGAYDDYVSTFSDYDTSAENTMSNIKYDLQDKGYTLEEDDTQVKVFKGNTPIARYELILGYYEGAQIELELLKDKDFIDDLYNTGELDFEDYITGVAEELNIYVKDKEDLYTPVDFEELEDIVDTATYDKFITKVYSDIAEEFKTDMQEVLKVVQENTTQLSYGGSFSNGEAMFSTI